jgi:hypothetical protein
MGQELQTVNFTESAMLPVDVKKQINLIQQVMAEAMKKDEHYGIIPGTQKPTLLKAGAEKLLLTFRLDPRYAVETKTEEKDFIAFTIRCDLHHINTGNRIASGLGSCNSRENKYRYRWTETDTGEHIPGDYKAKKQEYRKQGFVAKKIDNDWYWMQREKSENENPWELHNTLLKMACKRALVAAVLNGTAASDIFTQDLEDMDMGSQEPPNANGRGDNQEQSLGPASCPGFTKYGELKAKLEKNKTKLMNGMKVLADYTKKHGITFQDFKEPDFLFINKELETIAVLTILKNMNLFLLFMLWQRHRKQLQRNYLNILIHDGKA